MTHASRRCDAAPFGRLLTAMVTPFTADGSLDVDGAAAPGRRYLVDEQGNDALVINGTTGESPTTTDAREGDACCGPWSRRSATGPRSSPASAPTTPRTRSSWPAPAEKAGAHGLLVVTPYYNKPPQAGLLAHFTAVADATGLPVMLYDIPHRTGVADRDRDAASGSPSTSGSSAVKDAKGDLAATSWVLARTDLAYYSRRRRAHPAAAGRSAAVGVVGTLDPPHRRADQGR